MSTKSSNSAPVAEEMPKFTIDRLRADSSKLFGVSTSTFDGATHELDGEYTVEEMKNIIQKWMKKEVKV